VQLSELSTAEWVKLSELVIHLWSFAAALIVTGLTYMLAHAMIPSLMDTGDLPVAVARRMRAPLYTIAAVGCVAVVVVVIKGTLLALSILPDVYPRLAI
jgi:hypothetical protein